MRRLLYLSASIGLVLAALGMALLPRLVTNPLLFGLVGAILTGLIAGAWVMAGATAGQWPRPRAGWSLIIGGAVGTAVSLWSPGTIPLLWSLAVLVHGLLFTFPILPATRRRREPARKGPGPVRPPVSRRSASQ